MSASINMISTLQKHDIRRRICNCIFVLKISVYKVILVIHDGKVTVAFIVVSTACYATDRSIQLNLFR